jgi:hypothetical protein
LIRSRRQSAQRVVVHRDSVLEAIQISEHDAEVVTGDRRDLINRRSVRAGKSARRVVQAILLVRRDRDREGLRVGDAIDRRTLSRLV